MKISPFMLSDHLRFHPSAGTRHQGSALHTRTPALISGSIIRLCGRRSSHTGDVWPHVDRFW